MMTTTTAFVFKLVQQKLLVLTHRRLHAKVLSCDAIAGWHGCSLGTACLPS
jgi:hypothetical protein